MIYLSMIVINRFNINLLSYNLFNNFKYSLNNLTTHLQILYLNMFQEINL
jgi:hypothetical protein